MQSQPRYISLFLVFLVITLIAYWSTQAGGFITDFYGWQLRYNAGDWSSIWKSFDFPALHPVLHLVNYTWYKLFNTNGLAYYLLYSFLHAGNTFLLFHTFHRVFHIFKIANAFWLSLIAALFFLLSPYQTEVLVWRVCVHYLMATGLILWSWKMAVEYLEQPQQKRFLYYSHIAFLISLFTLEITLVAPFLLLSYLVFWTFFFKNNHLFKRNFIYLIAPQLAALGAYFILNRYLFGAVVGHYGADTHLQFPIEQMAANFFKYITKHLFFVRYFKHDVMNNVFSVFDQPLVLWSSVVTLCLLTLLGLLFFRKISIRLKLSALLIVFIAFALAPVLNLYFATLLPIENDRYGYFASVFIYTLFTVLIFGLPKWLRIPIVVLYLGTSVFYLQKTTNYWAEGTQLYQALLDDFRWENAKKVFVLTAPDNYRGVLLFRRYDVNNSLITPLELNKELFPKGEIIDIAQYNPPHLDAGATVTQDSTGVIKVKLNQYGNWWWRNGKGATNYETEDFSVQFSMIEYKLTLKQPLEDAVFIYQDGLQWKEFSYD